MTDSEINEAVARKLGWRFDKTAPPNTYNWIPPHPVTMWQEKLSFPLPYCTDIAAAWEIVEYVAKEAVRKGGGPLINICHDGVWHCSIGSIIVQTDIAPMAICLAFLKLLEAK